MVKCQQCGAEFKTWDNWIKRGGGRFCSHSCSAKSRTGSRNPKHNGSIAWACKMCGKEKITSPGRVGVFCSQSCKAKWQSIYVIGERHQNYKRIEATCEICGVIFGVKPFDKTRRFCSTSCRNKWFADDARRRQTIPDKERSYPLTFNRQFKTMIRKRDMYICLLCRQPGWDVHHIDYVKENTTPENCVTLCRRCHPKTNHNREYWKSKILEVINERS